VDTIKGLTQGVPRILDILDDMQIRATFFITMGPDKTGRNLFHLPKRKNIGLTTMSPVRKYGLKQMFYGLLIPSPIMEKHAHLIQKISKKGHEIGFHGYNHYQWANYFLKMSTEDIDKQIGQAINAFIKIIGKRPRGFAAPAFKWSKKSLLAADQWNFIYSSDMYGTRVFYPEIEGRKLNILQIPVSEPLIEDLVHQQVPDMQILNRFKKNLRERSLITVYTHASYEFLHKERLIRSILNESQTYDPISFLTFNDIAEELKKTARIRKITRSME